MTTADELAERLRRILVIESTSDSEIRLALRSHALEPEEAEILSTAQDLGILPTESTVAVQQHELLSQYIPPSQLRRETEYLETDTRRMNDEIARLKAGLTAIKTATRASKDALENLRRAFLDEEHVRQTHSDALDVVGLENDATIRKATSLAQTLLTRKNSSEDRTALSALLRQRRTIVRALETPPSHCDASADQDSLIREGTRLQRALDNLALDLAAQDICARLEAATEPAALAELLDATEADAPDSVDPALDVRVLLERAWRSDQLAALEALRNRLGTANAALAELLIPLRALHTSLNSRVTRTRELDALAGALLAELADIPLPDSVPESAHTPRPNHEPAFTPVEADAVRLLKDLEEYRTSPTPSALLAPSDLYAELYALRARLVASDAAEQGRATEIHESTVTDIVA